MRDETGLSNQAHDGRSFAPKHNPDEFLNNDVKQSMAKRPAAKNKDALKATLRPYMRGLQ